MTLVLAHRGAHGSERENTLEAFGEARRLGADGVELDVRRSADGALVVHHDAVVPGLGPVCELTVRQLPGHVPLLAAALDACDGMVVNIEVKNDPGEAGHEPDQAIALDVAAAVTGWGDDPWSQVIVSSFSEEAVAAARAFEPRLRVGWLLGWQADLRTALQRAAERGYQAVNPFVTSVGPAEVDRAHQLGLDLYVWTVNAPADLRAMVELGVDVVITDDVATALAAMDDVG